MNKFAALCIAWISAIILCGCNGKTESLNGMPIHISGNENDFVNSQQFIMSIDSIPLVVGRDMHIAPIQDVSMTDSFVYILDKMGDIFMFDVQSYNLRKAVNYTGHSKSEYIEPKSIISDGKNIFVLDFQGLSVIVYDEYLHYKEKISIGFPSLDFSKTTNGFVFYNMNPTEDLGRFVFTDMTGKVLQSFYTPKSEFNNMFTDRIFSEDNSGNVYFSEAMSDVIFKWDNKEVTSEYLLDIEQTQPVQPHSTNAIRSFVTSKFVITLFMANRFVMTNIYDKGTGTSMSGLVNTGIQYPFFPILTYKNSLIGVYELPMGNERDDGAEFMMIKYNLIH